MTDKELTKVIRRRVEDALRKRDSLLVNKVACLLGIGCREDGGHSYAEQECPKCKAIFCHDCCGFTNRHYGGKYQPDSTLCPVCGYDVDK